MAFFFEGGGSEDMKGGTIKGGGEGCIIGVINIDSPDNSFTDLHHIIKIGFHFFKDVRDKMFSHRGNNCNFCHHG